MAQAPGQDFDGMLQSFLVDLNGDGVPDAQVQSPAPARERGIQVAQIDGPSPSVLPGWMKVLALGGGAVAASRSLGKYLRGGPEEPSNDGVTVPSSASANEPRVVEHPPAPPTSSTSRGGVLDKLNIAVPSGAAVYAPRNALSPIMNGLNGAAGIADYYLMGVPSTLAGLVNSAIPGQPLGGLDEAKASAADARAIAARNSLGRDLLAMPEAFGGVGPGLARPGVGGRGPATSPYASAYARFDREEPILRRLQSESDAISETASKALPNYQGGLPPNEMFTGTKWRSHNDGGGWKYVLRDADPQTEVLRRAQERAGIQAREVVRTDRERPTMIRQAKGEAIDEAVSELGTKFPTEVTKITSDFPKFVNDIAEATRTHPLEVIRAMRDKGYDLSGLTRAAFQGPRQEGRFNPMTDEGRAMWDLIRSDSDVLYRNRAPQYEPVENALSPMIKPKKKN